ncbi:unnamed protein product [Lupinus luteus]|uniref:Uncharacterized protein n=1 Tax=Lupinus luteus TaxID=3873 RepID=A0AAV1WSE7_LUPLU
MVNKRKERECEGVGGKNNEEESIELDQIRKEAAPVAAAILTLECGKDTIQNIRTLFGAYETAEDAARAHDDAAHLLRGAHLARTSLVAILRMQFHLFIQRSLNFCLLGLKLVTLPLLVFLLFLSFNMSKKQKDDSRLEHECVNNADNGNNEIMRPKGEVEEGGVGIIDFQFIDNIGSSSYSASPFETAEKMLGPMEEVEYDLEESPFLRETLRMKYELSSQLVYTP